MSLLHVFPAALHRQAICLQISAAAAVEQGCQLKCITPIIRQHMVNHVEWTTKPLIADVAWANELISQCNFFSKSAWFCVKKFRYICPVF